MKNMKNQQMKQYTTFKIKIVYEKLLKDYVKSVFKDFESHLRTKRVPGESNQLILKICNSRCVNFETPPGLHEMIDINNTLNNLVNINIVTNDKTKKTSLTKQYFEIWREVF